MKSFKVAPNHAVEFSPWYIRGSAHRFWSILQVLDRILRVDYNIPRSPRVSEECKDLMRRILVADPADRLTIPQIQVLHLLLYSKEEFPGWWGKSEAGVQQGAMRCQITAL